MASDFSIRHAADIIKHGGVIAYPTDTIYGLGCDPYNYDAVEKVNRIKQRPLNKRFIILADDIEQIKPLVVISEEQEKIIMHNDEPTSWVIAANPQAPSWLIDDTRSSVARKDTAS